MVETQGLSENDLMSLLKKGDHAAFEEIFRRYSTLLYAHAFNKLRDAEDAHDAVQEVFSKLWIRRDQLVVGNNLAGYLFVAVRNQIFDIIRHKKVITAFEESFREFEVANYPVTDHRVRENILAELIEREIAALPPRMREVFELRRKEHLSNKEIAERMGIKESTVADQMKKALRALRLKLGLVILLGILFNF